MTELRLRRPTTLPIDHWSEPDHGFATMRVTSPFAQRGRSFHGGLDIGNGRLGDVVVAAAAGEVIASGNLRQPWSTPDSRYPSGNTGGLMVVIEPAPDVALVYAHLGSRKVTVGSRVAAGDVIGTVGDTGAAAPPPLGGGGGHLHFTVQAPAGSVPANVATHPTAYGLGLDVDPWPLISGQAVLTLEVNDMRISGEFLRHLHNVRAALTSDAHFRAGVVAGADPSLGVLESGARIDPVVVVKGRAVGTAPDRAEWYGSIKTAGLAGGPAFGYVHSSVLPRTADGKGVALEQITEADTAALEAAIAGARTDIGQASSALERAATRLAAD